MNTLDEAGRMRALERYRLIFRLIVVTFAASLVMTGAGLIAAFNGASTTWFGLGLLLASISGLDGYKTVLSTMKLIEVDARERGWRNLAP